MTIVNNAVYVDGRKSAEPNSLRETYEHVRNRDGLAWIGLYKPTEEEFTSVAEEFGLHELAVEDAIQAHQRPSQGRQQQPDRGFGQPAEAFELGVDEGFEVVHDGGVGGLHGR